MTIEKSIRGAYVISDIIKGHLVTRQYYFYTRKAAIAQFKADINIKKGA